MSTQVLVHSNVCNSIIHNTQKVDTTQMSTNKQTHKQNGVYSYTGLLSTHKKEESTLIHYTLYNMDDPRQHCLNVQNKVNL